MRKLKKLEKSETYGLIGTVLFGVLLILLLLWLKFSIRNFDETMGLTINFGDTMQGQGLFEPTPMSALASPMPSPSVPTPTPPTPPAPAEALQTQSIEESIEAIETRRREQEERAEERRRFEEERERLRLEQERVAEERRQEEARLAELRRIEAERQAQAEAIAQRTQAALAAAGNQAGGGEGTSTTAGNQGNPFGDTAGGAAGTNVAGGATGAGGDGNIARVGTRRVVGALPLPADDTQVEGRVVVDIRVNPEGVVIQADIGQGTNITQPAVRNAALAAARQARFTPGDRTELGTITYHFRLN